jgi:hypothetical protein
LLISNCGTAAGYCGLWGTNASVLAATDVVVEGGTLSVDSPQVFRTLTVRNGGWVTHRQGNTNGLRLHVLGSVVVEPNGAISADGRGFAYRQGPGAGTGDLLGANYGGAGFNGAATYGSPITPTDLGSGGGSGYGANGGGAIQLTVDGLLQVDGRVGADAPYDASGLGAGSGGSLYVVAQALAGAGAITARGGSSYSTTHSYIQKRISKAR